MDIVLVTVILLVAAALTLSGCDSKGPEGKGAAAVEPAPVTIPLSSLGTAEFKSFSPEFSYPAAIEAVQKANARVDINARIGKIHPLTTTMSTSPSPMVVKAMWTSPL